MGSGESDLVLKTGGEQGSLLTTPFLFLTSLNALPSLSILYPCLWQGLISVLWYFAWVFWAWRKLVSSGLGWVFRSCWGVAVSWSHFLQVDTENMSSALPSWCSGSERAGRCLNPAGCESVPAVMALWSTVLQISWRRKRNIFIGHDHSSHRKC